MLVYSTISSRKRDNLYPWSAPIPLVRVKGNYREMGIQHGQQTKKLIQRAVKHARTSLPSLLNVSMTEILHDVAQYAQNIKQLNKGFDEEIEGLAEGADISHEDIVLLNTQVDTLLVHGGRRALEPLLCSAFAAWGNATGNGYLVAGHNDDGDRVTDQFLALLHARPEVGHDFFVPVIPGYLGYHTIVNDAGLCVFGLGLENGPVREEARIGTPRYIIFRYLAQFVDNVESAVRFLRDVDFGNAISFILLDRERNAAIIHRTAQDAVVIRPKEDYLVLTNHALVDEVKPHLMLRQYPESSHFRFESMNRAVKCRLGKINVRAAIEIMKTHYDASVKEENPSENTPCRHYEYGGRLSGTCRSAVVKLGRRQMSLFVALGNPCIGQWVEVDMKYKPQAAS